MRFDDFNFSATEMSKIEGALIAGRDTGFTGLAIDPFADDLTSAEYPSDSSACGAALLGSQLAL